MVETSPGGFTIEESARRLGHARWIEMRLFELLGRWVALTPEPEIKVWLASSSRHHSWHAELLEERLPEVRELSPERQTVAPDPEFGAFVAALESFDEPTMTIDRLVGVHQVLLPHLVAAYTAHLANCTPVADQAVARTLRFILGDETDEIIVGTAFLHELVASGDGPAAAETRSELERLLAASCGISGR